MDVSHIYYIYNCTAKVGNIEVLVYNVVTEGVLNKIHTYIREKNNANSLTLTY